MKLILLRKNDAAVVFKGSGETEILVPAVEGIVPKTAMAAMLCGVFLKTPELVEKAMALAEKMRGQEKDACEKCKGEKGGVPGNENIVDGVVMCDYCSVEHMRNIKK